MTKPYCCEKFEYAVKENDFTHYYNTTEENTKFWWMRFYTTGELYSSYKEDNYYLIKFCPFCGMQLI